MSCKVLLSGAVNGNFESFEKRLNSANAKAGPFAAVFVVGAFFAPGSSTAACPESSIQFIDKFSQLPMPVYFFVDEGACSAPRDAAVDANCHSHAITVTNIYEPSDIVLFRLRIGRSAGTDCKTRGQHSAVSGMQWHSERLRLERCLLC